MLIRSQLTDPSRYAAVGVPRSLQPWQRVPRHGQVLEPVAATAAASSGGARRSGRREGRGAAESWRHDAGGAADPRESHLLLPVSPAEDGPLQVHPITEESPFSFLFQLRGNKSMAQSKNVITAKS